MTKLTRKEGAKMGAILVDEHFFMTPEEYARYKRLSQQPGGTFPVVGYLVEKKFWEFWR